MTFSSVFHELAAILMLAGVIGVVALKLLSDTREIDSLHGRIAVGFLVVQDIAVILAMILLTSFNLKGGGGIAAQAIRLLLVGSAFVLGTAATMRWVMPPLLDRLDRTGSCWCCLPWAWRPWPMSWASARRWERSWGVCRSPPPPTAKRSLRGSRACAISCCCSSSSTWAQASTSRRRDCSWGPPCCSRPLCWWAIR